MTLYPGPVVSQEYAHGRDTGYGEGEADRANSITVSAVIAAAQFDAQSCKTRNERAWWLGYLRGYRMAVRTLRNGRWGT